jgi:hypothetical protein
LTRKVAVFVEGQTELYFTLWVLRSLAVDTKMHVEAVRIGGGTHRVALYKMPVATIGELATAEVHFLVVDCSSDERVVSFMREQHASLKESGYEAILGLRDLRPDFSIDELALLKEGIAKTLSNLVEPTPEIAVAIQEVEAWFIAENTHFNRMDPNLTASAIMEGTGIDVTQETESIPVPYETLDQIYQIVGLRYAKSQADVIRTLGTLQFDEFERLVPHSAPSALIFLDLIRAHLTVGGVAQI